jgi:hypothetical protein
MDLKPFLKKPVQAGEPLTAAAWNDVLDAIDGSYQFLLATQHTVTVTITNTDLDPETVRVTASSSTGALVEAVRSILSGKDHVLSRLEPGAWTVTAEAHGYTAATKAIDVPTDATVQLALTKAGGFMPDLFGAQLGTAKAALAVANITLVHLFDFNGRELPTSSTDNDDKLVLVQWPPPDAALSLNGGGARLVIGVPVQVEPAVAVPVLTSLNQQEAQKALEAVGLTLGKVTFVQR